MSSSYGARQSSIESELARFFADIDDDDASDGADTVTRPADTHRSRTTVRPTLASDDESPPPVAASSSRAGPSRQRVTRSTAEPPRERRTGGSRPEVIDLSALSDDDDVEITGETIAPRPPPASRATPLNLASIPPPSRFPTVPDEIASINRVLAEREASQRELLRRELIEARTQAEEALQASTRRYQASRTQNPPLRFGGAVLTQGNRRLHYEPVAPASAPAPAPTAQAPPPFPPTLQQFMGLAGRQYLQHYAAQLPALSMLIRNGGGLAIGTSRSMGGQRFQDPQTIVDSVSHFTYPKASKRFTRDFKIPEPPITLNEDGQPVDSPPFEQYLSCAKCDEYLRVQSGMRDPDDRIFALTCGHLIDQRCLHELSIPTTEAQKAAIVPPGDTALDAPSPKRRRTRQRRKRKDPETFVWFCPVKDCGQEHTSARFPDTEDWVTYEGAGATQLYV